MQTDIKVLVTYALQFRFNSMDGGGEPPDISEYETNMATGW